MGLVGGFMSKKETFENLHDQRVTDLRLAQMDPTDICGMPYVEIAQAAVEDTDATAQSVPTAKLEIGKWYRTHEGRFAKLIDYNDDNSLTPYTALVTTSDDGEWRVLDITAKGDYYFSRSHYLVVDTLIEQVVDTTTMFAELALRGYTMPSEEEIFDMLLAGER